MRVGVYAQRDFQEYHAYEKFQERSYFHANEPQEWNQALRTPLLSS